MGSFHRVSATNVSGASGYYIYRKTGFGSWSKIATIQKNSTVSYTDTAVKSKNGTAHTYTVKAYKGSSTVSGSANVSKTYCTLSCNIFQLFCLNKKIPSFA